MSYEEREQIFLYHGYAVGVGGYVERNGNRLAIPALTPAALPLTGGKSVMRQGAWSWAPPDDPPPSDGGFRISVGASAVTLLTEEKEDAWVTYAQVTVEDFNLCDRLTIGLMVGTLTSVHKKGIDYKPEARISFAGSELFNVYVDGVQIDVPVDRALDRFQTYEELRAVIKGDAGPTPDAQMSDDDCKRWRRDFRSQKLFEATKSDPLYVRNIEEWGRKTDRLTRCSIAGPIGKPEKALKHVGVHGYSIWIQESDDKPEFGRIFFGEMIVSQGMKSLNMVRWNLGCDNCSDGTGGAPSVNGGSMP